ncbi:aminopeptidase P N-terminal domain-containing protein [Algiphilus sp.]|uniref:aminopeptidase P N-terminal domain-containing protein n=1 Tax=Algiphilus sp. TaxID=1872431 RepID=UPI003BAA689A
MNAPVASKAPPSPLTTDDFARRRAALAEIIGKDGVVILPANREQPRNRDVHYPFRQDSDFLYLTGFPEPDAIAVFAPGRGDGAFVLFVRPRDAEREIWDGRRYGTEGACSAFGADAAFTLDAFEAQLPNLLAGRRHVHMQLGDRPELDQRVTQCVQRMRELSRRGPGAPEAFLGLDTSLHELRLIKDEQELAHMRFAAEVSAAAHRKAMQMAAPGLTEWQLQAEIHAVFGRNDMEPGYGSIVGAGANACVLHYIENRATLRDGDLILIDAGGEYHGYTADITRTFPANGRFSAEQAAVYDIVLAAQQAAIDKVRRSETVDAMHAAATRVLTQGMVDLGWLQGAVDGLIERGAQRRFFMHGTGHWLGMDVHDVGRYRVDDHPRPLQPGMVTTVEPGLYVQPDDESVDAQWRGMGIRIEDDVLVTDGTPEILTQAVPKERAAIEALMADRGA